MLRWTVGNGRGLQATTW